MSKTFQENPSAIDSQDCLFEYTVINDDTNHIFAPKEGTVKLEFEGDIIYIEAQPSSHVLRGQYQIEIFTLYYAHSNKSRDHIMSFFSYVSKFSNMNSSNTIKVMTYSSSNGGWCSQTKIAKRDIKSIYIPEKELSSVITDITSFLEKKSEYIRVGRPHRRNYLFYGPPGTGKTSLITAIASKLDFGISSLVLSSTMTDEDLVSAISGVYKKNFIVLEDVDSVVHSSGQRTLETPGLSFSTLLNILDGHIRKEDTIVIMTTNFPQKMKGVLGRKGRVDYLLEFKNMDKTGIKNMTSYFFNKTSQEDIDSIVDCVYEITEKKLSASSLQDFLFGILLEHGPSIKSGIVIKRKKELWDLLGEEQDNVDIDVRGSFYS